MSFLDEMLSALMWYYGCNKREARDLLESNSSEFNEIILSSFRENARKAFYND